MGYIRLDEQPGEVYHYTHRKNLDSILRDGRIRRMGDRECWFCASLEDTLTLMRATVMMEGKPYYKVGGSTAAIQVCAGGLCDPSAKSPLSER